MKRLTEKQKAEIYHLYVSGNSQQKVGEILNIERTVVGWWVRKFGIQRNLSESHKGQHSSPKTEFKKGQIPWNKGKRPEYVQGKNNPNWKNGSGQHRDRYALEYKEWRRKVLIKDDYTCQKCGENKFDLLVHHIKSFNDYPELRFEIDNGQVLCRACHCKVHNPRRNHAALTYTGS